METRVLSFCYLVGRSTKFFYALEILILETAPATAKQTTFYVVTPSTNSTITVAALERMKVIMTVRH